MKRIDRIYNYIENNSKKFTKNKLLEVKGFSAQEIGEYLEILRSNVSRELNTLCRDSKIIKIKIDLFFTLIEKVLRKYYL